MNPLHCKGFILFVLSTYATGKVQNIEMIEVKFLLCH